jgi:membrane protein implicated in regulation of membrane protease activity
MSDWINWLVIAGIVVVLELFSGTFYLLMIAIGLVAGALVASIGWSVEFQLIAAALVGSIATILLRRSRFGSRSKVDASRDPNVNLDIGQSIQVDEWKSDSTGAHNARSMYRGAQWDVSCISPGALQPGMFKIVEIRGSQLIVEPT